MFSCMSAEKEVQKMIIEKKEGFDKATDEEFYSVLKTVAPGTNLRTALNGILKAGKGAIIAIENEWLLPLIEGGFELNTIFTPQRLIELSKMDGAIILSKDMKKIIFANALLTPDSKIFSHETGTRHKAAERTAKQSGILVIAISERRNEITLYYKNLKHSIINSNDILRKVNENIQLIEKQREIFDNSLEKLNRLEFRGYPSLHQAAKVIQKGEIIRKLALELQQDILELGKEGDILKIRLKEIMADVEEETDLVIKDYTLVDVKKSKSLLNELSYEEIIDREKILNLLAYESIVQSKPVSGWRVLSKTSLSEHEIFLLIKELENLSGIISSHPSIREFVLGRDRANLFENEIEQLKMNF